jgi:hypothetical protein
MIEGVFSFALDDIDLRAARRLAATALIRAIEDARRMPMMAEPYLVMVLESPEGKRLLEIAGLGHLTDMPPGELARRALSNAERVLDASRRCANCAFLQPQPADGNGRVRCALGIWDERAGAGGVEYSVSTVRNSSRPMFEACEHFETRAAARSCDGMRHCGA